MKSGIQLTFENCKKEKRPVLLTYTVASDPNKKKSLQIINSIAKHADIIELGFCLLYTSPSPRDRTRSRMPSSA